MTEVPGGAMPVGAVEGSFAVCVRLHGSQPVVVMSGSLDLASRADAVRACISTDHPDVLVDMARVVFMDCAGYGALVEARAILRARHGSLAIMNLVGEPQLLSSLIDRPRPDPTVSARSGVPAASSAPEALR